MGLKAYFSVVVIALLLLACKPIAQPPSTACNPNDKLCIPPSTDNLEPTQPPAANVTVQPPVQPPPVEPATPPVTTPPKSEETVGLPRVVVTEGGLVSLSDIKARDADNDVLTYTYSEPLSKKGEWQTKVGDAGEYLVTISVSDKHSTVAQKVLVIVKSLNKAPVISGVQDITVDEGDLVSLKPVVTDDDKDNVTLRISGWISVAEYRTTFEDAGTHFVTITASDGKSETSKQIKVIVRNVNRAPVLADFTEITVIEGALVTVKPIAIDQDSEKVTYTFDQPLDRDGKWQTKVGDAGNYNVNIAATDGVSRDVKAVKIKVNPQNRPPVIQIADRVEVNAGETVVLSPQVTDPDGNSVTVSYSGWMTTNTKATTQNEGGDHMVTITASDGKASASKSVTVVVNRPPEFII
ncbi:MAG: hypothetical protein V1735_05540 [Nanoarchaeota archaeon]